MKALALALLRRLGSYGKMLAAVLGGVALEVANQLAPMALQIVAQLALNGDMNNNQKREAAFNQLKDRAITLGITVSADTLYNLIQNAYTEHKASAAS